MSTRTDAAYDDATTTSPRTDPTTDDFSASTEDQRPASADSPPTDDAPAPHGDTAWTDRCKRQFSTTDTGRLRNLNDDENQAMQDGV